MSENICQMKNKYDVTVVGGGVAGVVAAIQAARAGASTLLIEKNAMLGGIATNGGINFPGLFHAWGKQVIAGIGWELILKTVGDDLPDFHNSLSPHFSAQIPIDIALFASVCDETVIDSGATLLFHGMLAEAKFDHHHWKLKICTKTGLIDIDSKVLIDCTGDGNATEIAGFELIKPERCQPSTLSCRVSGYDPDELDYGALDKSFNDAVENNLLQAEYACWYTDHPKVSGWLRGRGNNANHIFTESTAGTSEGRTSLEVESRKALRKLILWLKTQPGLENISVESLCPETGVRETAQIRGEIVITKEDYVNGRIWPDSLCYAFYPTDKHGMDSNEWDFHQLKEGIFPTIPRAALIPKGSQFLMAAGRLVSADRIAMSSLRVQAACMAMGQVVGAVSALSAKQSITPSQTAIEEVKDILIKHNAIVP